MDENLPMRLKYKSRTREWEIKRLIGCVYFKLVCCPFDLRVGGGAEYLEGNLNTGLRLIKKGKSMYSVTGKV